MSDQPHLSAKGNTKRDAMLGLVALLYMQDPEGEHARMLEHGWTEGQIASLLCDAGYEPRSEN